MRVDAAHILLVTEERDPVLKSQRLRQALEARPFGTVAGQQQPHWPGSPQRGAGLEQQVVTLLGTQMAHTGHHHFIPPRRFPRFLPLRPRRRRPEALRVDAVGNVAQLMFRQPPLLAHDAAQGMRRRNHAARPGQRAAAEQHAPPFLARGFLRPKTVLGVDYRAGAQPPRGHDRVHAAPVIAQHQVRPLFAEQLHKRGDRAQRIAVARRRHAVHFNPAMDPPGSLKPAIQRHQRVAERRAQMVDDIGRAHFGAAG